METFISSIYKQLRAFPMAKDLSKAVYKITPTGDLLSVDSISPAIAERLRQTAAKQGYQSVLTADYLTVNFN